METQEHIEFTDLKKIKPNYWFYFIIYFLDDLKTIQTAIGAGKYGRKIAVNNVCSTVRSRQ